MADPLTVAVFPLAVMGAVAVIDPFIKACHRLYDGTRSLIYFGPEFFMVRAHLLNHIKTLDYLYDYQIKEIDNVIEDPRQREKVLDIVYRIVQSMEKDFGRCQKWTVRLEQLKAANKKAAASSTASKHDLGRNATQKTSKSNPKPAIKPESSKNLSAKSGQASASSKGLGPIFESKEVKKLSQTKKQQLEALQSSSTLYSRILWATVGKKRLLKRVESLEKASQKLTNQAGRLYLVDMESVRGALGQLHEALAPLNHRQEGDEPFYLSVRLEANWISSQQRLKLETGVKVRDNCLLVSIQREDSLDLSREPTLLMVDSPMLVTKEPDNSTAKKSGKILIRLDITQADTSKNPTSKEPRSVNLLGYVETPSNPDHLHVLFHNRTAVWRSIGNLNEAIASDVYTENLEPAQIIWLARLIVGSHFCFSQIRDALGVHTRTQHYRYFRKSDETGTFWGQERTPPVLQHWLSCGFGSEPPNDPSNDYHDDQMLPSRSVNELGMVLYQLGSGIGNLYGPRLEDLNKAKKEALKNMDTVRVAGKEYQEIVQQCLTWKTETKIKFYKTTAAQIHKEETELIKGVFEQLTDTYSVFEDLEVSEVLKTMTSSKHKKVSPDQEEDLGQTRTRTRTRT